MGFSDHPRIRIQWSTFTVGLLEKAPFSSEAQIGSVQRGAVIKHKRDKGCFIGHVLSFLLMTQCIS